MNNIPICSGIPQYEFYKLVTNIYVNQTTYEDMQLWIKDDRDKDQQEICKS